MGVLGLVCQVLRRVVSHLAVDVLGSQSVVNPVDEVLARLLLSFVLVLHKVVGRVLFVGVTRALVVLGGVLVIRRYIQAVGQLGVGALQQVLVSHCGRFLGGLLMPVHHIQVVAVLVLRGALARFGTALGESRSWLASLALFGGVLWLSLEVGVLVHDQHIVAVTNAMLICNFAGLCGSGGVLLIENILKLPHSLGLLDAELLALLVPAPLVDLRFCEQSLLRNHQEGLLGPVGVLLELSQQLVQLVCGLSFPFPD